MADDVFGRKRIDLDDCAALPAVRAQVVQSFELAAFALPVADPVLDEFQRRRVAEIGDRKCRSKDRLQTGVVALLGQQIHLQEAVIAFALHFDQIRNPHRCFDLGKVIPLAFTVLARADRAA